VLNIRSDFRPTEIPGDFALARHIPGGRRLNNQEVKNISSFHSFNNLWAFFLNAHHCFIMPNGWNRIDVHPQSRADRELNWWSDYSEFRKRIRATLHEENDVQKRKQLKNNSSSSSKGKGKAKVSRTGGC
jgi:hypothetical protein